MPFDETGPWGLNYMTWKRKWTLQYLYILSPNQGKAKKEMKPIYGICKIAVKNSTLFFRRMDKMGDNQKGFTQSWNAFLSCMSYVFWRHGIEAQGSLKFIVWLLIISIFVLNGWHAEMKISCKWNKHWNSLRFQNLMLYNFCLRTNLDLNLRPFHFNSLNIVDTICDIPLDSSQHTYKWNS